MNKKRKIVSVGEKHAFNVAAVLDESAVGINAFIEMLVLRVQQKKQLSQLVSVLAKHFPVLDFKHLKRVYKRKCKEPCIENANESVGRIADCYFIYVDSIKSFISSSNFETDSFFLKEPKLEIVMEGEQQLLNLSEITSSTLISNIKNKLECLNPSLFFEEYYIAKVAKFPPRLKTTHAEACKYWPCTFHEDAYLTKVLSPEFFNSSELGHIKKRIQQVLGLSFTETFPLSSQCSSIVCSESACIVVDPTNNSVICQVQHHPQQEHPLAHSVMIAVDKVGKFLGGSAWVLDNEDRVLTNYYCTKISTLNKIVSGHPSGYICSGYDVYLSCEPCMMCAMVLLHSRVRRIFFCHTNEKNGSLLSRVRLHTLPGINHRFEVFKVTFNS